MKFCSNRFEKLLGINEMNALNFWGGGGDGMRGGGFGVRAVSQILSEERLSYSSKHIFSGWGWGGHSLHISWGSTHLHLYFLFWCRIVIQ